MDKALYNLYDALDKQGQRNMIIQWIRLIHIDRIDVIKELVQNKLIDIIQIREWITYDQISSISHPHAHTRTYKNGFVNLVCLIGTFDTTIYNQVLYDITLCPTADPLLIEIIDTVPIISDTNIKEIITEIINRPTTLHKILNQPFIKKYVYENTYAVLSWIATIDLIHESVRTLLDYLDLDLITESFTKKYMDILISSDIKHKNVIKNIYTVRIIESLDVIQNIMNEDDRNMLCLKIMNDPSVQ